MIPLLVAVHGDHRKRRETSVRPHVPDQIRARHQRKARGRDERIGRLNRQTRDRRRPIGCGVDAVTCVRQHGACAGPLRRVRVGDEHPQPDGWRSRDRLIPGAVRLPACRALLLRLRHECRTVLNGRVPFRHVPQRILLERLQCAPSRRLRAKLRSGRRCGHRLSHGRRHVKYFGEHDATDNVLEWIRRIDQTTKWTTSVCVGSLILGAAGLLKGVPATSHWNTLQDLRYFGAIPTEDRFVRHRKIMTEAGVLAGIDMALQLVAIEYGEDVAKSVQLLIEYDPHPPLDSGSTAKASAATIDRARQMLRDMYAQPR